MKIVIDAGHGGNATGAIGADGTEEKTLNLYAAIALQSFLLKQGHQVLMTRLLDVDVSLSGRTKFANKLNADLFLSLHCNANRNRRAKGIECYTSKGETKSDKWARKIQTLLLTIFKDRKDFAGKGSSEENFYVLHKTKMPAVLIEMGFISNDEEREWLKKNYPSIAWAISNAIEIGIED